MDNDKSTIMIVDDNPVVRLSIESIFEDDYNILCAEDGADCLMHVQDTAPDLVFLDIEMPGLDGYQTCKKIRAFSDVPIIFVSSRDSLDERVAAFNAGGDDFVSKPFDGEILALKAAKILASQKRISQISVEKQAMQSMAMDLLNITSEGRLIIDFMSAGLECQHHEDLADSFVKTVNAYGINSIVQIRHANGVVNRSIGITASPLEDSLMGDRPEQQGVFAFKHRLMINKQNVSVLIPNMPAQADLAERIKNNVLLLVEATENLVNTINVRRDATITTENLQVAALSAYGITTELQSDYHQQQADTRLLLHGLIDKMEKSYFSLGLTEGQENRISELLRRESESILELFQKGTEGFDAKFAEIMAALSPQKENSGDVWL